MIHYKKVRETDTEYAHINVFFDDEYMGYITKDDFENELKSWVFTSKNLRISYFRGTTLKDIKETLNKIYKGIPVDLTLHFGMSDKNYLMKTLK